MGRHLYFDHFVAKFHYLTNFKRHAKFKAAQPVLANENTISSNLKPAQEDLIFVADITEYIEL